MTLNIQRISWCGIQVAEFAPAVELCSELLGMRLIKLAPERDLAIWVLPSGQGFEVFGPRHQGSMRYEWPVVSFDVPSVAAARAALERRGVELASEIMGAPGGRVWMYFHDPDGYLYEISEPWEWRRAPGAVPENAEPSPEHIVTTTRAFPWMAIRPRDFSASVEFFSAVLGLQTYRLNEERDFAHFLLPSGEAIELFGPRNPHAEVTGGPVLGLEVDDVAKARAGMEARGVEFITETRGLEPGGRTRAYFRGPGGYTQELVCSWVWR